jgi:hypothetical protein
MQSKMDVRSPTSGIIENPTHLKNGISSCAVGVPKYAAEPGRWNNRGQEWVMTGLGRGCVKTLFDTKFGCLRTIAEALIVDPGAFYEVAISRHSSLRVFSHSLGREYALDQGSAMQTEIRHEDGNHAQRSPL